MDAHNLYLETLAELGPFGLVLLAAMLALPLVAALRVREHPFASAATGAYAAFLFHAALDWDWEMPAVTLAGLVCASAAPRPHDPDGHPERQRRGQLEQHDGAEHGSVLPGHLQPGN